MINRRNASSSDVAERFRHPDLLFRIKVPTGEISRVADARGQAVKFNLWKHPFQGKFASDLDSDELSTVIRRLAYGAAVDVLAWIDGQFAFMRFQSAPPPAGSLNRRESFRDAEVFVAYINSEDACRLYDHDNRIIVLSSCFEWHDEIEEPAEAMLCS